eukprot:TRINITY_DN191_c0_g1_i5.p1 TRINITY_DN191_c0_g1~~TRINITY_DN191_c0_g1_i5.p1  ORF type:complete len:624 (+),score=297.38 TRINITY_DN191_c0_g1_i5:129-1874(+)
MTGESNDRQEKLEETTAALEATKVTLETTEANLKERDAQLEETKQSLENLTNASSEQASDLSEKLSSLQANLKQVTEESNDRQAKLDETTSELETIKAALNEKTEESKTRQAMVEEVAATLEATKAALNDATAENNELQTKLVDTETSLVTAQSTLEARGHEAEEAFADVADELASVKQQLEKALGEAKEKEAVLVEVEVQREQQAQALVEVKEELQAVKAQNEEKEIELKEAKEELRVVAEQKAEQEEVLVVVKEELKAAGDAQSKKSDEEHSFLAAKVADLEWKLQEADNKEAKYNELEKKYSTIRDDWVAMREKFQSSEQRLHTVQQVLREKESLLDKERKEKDVKQQLNNELGKLANKHAGDAMKALDKMHGMDKETLEMLRNMFGTIQTMELDLRKKEEEILSLPEILKVKYEDEQREGRRQVDALKEENALLKLRLQETLNRLERSPQPPRRESQGFFDELPATRERSTPPHATQQTSTSPAIPPIAPPPRMPSLSRTPFPVPNTSRPHHQDPVQYQRAAQTPREDAIRVTSGVGRAERVPTTDTYWKCNGCDYWQNRAESDTCILCDRKRPNSS